VSLHPHACDLGYHRFVRLRLCLAVTLAACGGERELAPDTVRDGERWVTVERMTGDEVRLHYDDRQVSARVDGTVIVALDRGAEAEIEARGGRLVRPLMPSLGLWLAEDLADGDGVELARRLGGDSARAAGIRYAFPDVRVAVRPAYMPNDPRLSGQWYFENLGMADAWELSRGAANISIVVVDTGCDMMHEDLAAKMDEGLDLVDGDTDPSFDPTYEGASHGTACAGLVAAATDNNLGIAGGCPDCRMRCVRLLGQVDLPISSSVEVYQFALDVDAAVVSNSWGFQEAIPVPLALADSINAVADNGRGGRGALVLFAVGNDDRQIGDDELQAVRGVLGIGAINNFDESTPFTNFGNAVDVVVPTGTLTTDISGAGGDDPTDYMSLFGGTSSACPVAAGIAGLLASAAPDKTSAELYDIVMRTTRPAPFAEVQGGHDPVYGYGIVQPVEALRQAMGLDPPTSSVAASGGGNPPEPPDDDTESCTCRAAAAPTHRGSIYLALGLLALLRRRKK